MKVTHLLPLLLVSVVGCDTGALRIEDCRTLEYARCDAAQRCGQIPDAQECRHYYRDHCLHGVALGTVITDSDVEACRTTLENAGLCAEEEGKDTPTMECSEEVSEETVPATASVCDVVEFPLLAKECQFLAPLPVEDGGS